MRSCVFALVFAVVFFSGGCTKSEPRVPVGAPAPPGFSSPDGEPILRLTHAYLDARKAFSTPALQLEPKTFTLAEFALKQDGEEPLRGVATALDAVDSSHYTDCHVRLRASAASTCRIAWKTEHQPQFLQPLSIPFAVLNDGQYHDYTVDLDGADPHTWNGTINSLGVFGDAGGSIEIESMTLSYTPPAGPRRVSLTGVTCEAIDAPRFAWQLTVPNGAMLEVSAGCLRVLPKTVSDAVFTVTVAATNAAPREVIRHTVKGGDTEWMPLRADLTAFAGQPVTLQFAAALSAPASGVYPQWGDPLVTRGDVPDAAPVILISCDTTRAEHLGCYGYARDTSPNIDAFARESVLFENAITPETWTLTAHMSMLTGLYPTHHGVNSTTNLAESVVTLPEALSAAGYATAGFTGYQIWLQPTRGLSHGFDLYSTPDIERDGYVRDLFKTLALTNAWLDAHRAQPFFLFFHNYDIHSKYIEAKCEGCDLPYYPARAEFVKFSKDIPEPESLRRPGRKQSTNLLFAANEQRDTLTPQEIEYMTALYDDAIVGVDHAIGELFAKLKAMGVYDKALIILASDHGELFGEHGNFLHEHVYEGAARVPLIMKFPKQEYAGKRVPEMVQLIDLLPTVLGHEGVAIPACDGQDLLPVIRGEAKPAGTAFIRRQRHIAVRTNEWKLIRGITAHAPELYHLTEDPHETKNLADANAAMVEALGGQLDQFFNDSDAGWHVAFTGTKGDQRIRFVATTGDRFETAALRYGGHLSREDLYTKNEHTLSASLGPLKREEIVLRTASPTGVTMIRVESDLEFSVQLGSGAPVIGKQFETSLDPATPLAKPETTGAVPAGALPFLRVWYQEQPKKGTEATALTNEEKDALRSLGYGSETE